MAVLVTAEVPGQTKEGYEGMLAVLGPLLKQTKGFIAHGAGPVRADVLPGLAARDRRSPPGAQAGRPRRARHLGREC